MFTMSQWLKDIEPGITLAEERECYNEMLQRVINNPRYYLDLVGESIGLWEFKVSFLDYNPKRRKLYKGITTLIY